MATGKVINKTQVYFGPSTSYPSDNSYAGPNDTVTILWAEGTWYYIEYPAGTKRKRMYIKNSAVSQKSGSIPTYNPNLKVRYCFHPTTTYCGPSSTKYASAGSIGKNEEVYFLYYKKENNYAFIEYKISNSKKKRAWVDSTKLGTELQIPSLVVGQRPSDMNFNGKCYMSNTNFYYAAKHSLAGQCTWFCWGRAYEKTGKKLSFNGPNNGAQWYQNINTSNVKKRAASLGPVTNSICSISYGKSKAGHVIFIEQVKGSTVYYTEANFPRDDKPSSDDGLVKSCSKSQFPKSGTAKGYIVL